MVVVMRVGGWWEGVRGGGGGRGEGEGGVCKGKLPEKQLKFNVALRPFFRAQELCESRGGRPGLSVLTSLMVSVDVKQ